MCLKYDPSKGDKIRIVLAGDTGTGKTCAIINYMENRFNDEYVPSLVLDVRKARKVVHEIAFRIEIQDTSGLDEHLTNRMMQYRGADVFILCFAVD